MSGLFSDGIGFFSGGGSSGGSVTLAAINSALTGGALTPTQGINNTGPFTTLFNTTAVPAASPGLAITENHSAGGSEVNFWNTNSSVAGFDWWNLVGGVTPQRLMYLNSLGTLNVFGGLNLVMPAIAGSEVVFSAALSDDAVAKVQLKNGTSANNIFIPWLVVNGSTTNTALAILVDGQTDSGGAPIVQFNMTSAGGQAVNRTLIDLQNNGTSQLTLAANGTLTQANGQAVKSSTRLTTPVTVGLTDYIVGSNLTTPGPVSVVLPTAAGNAGRIFTVKDEKGDAAANPVTLSVTGGGNINGAATFVIANAYGGANVYSNGTQWFTH